MGKKAQIMIIALWILVILTVLTISIGQRVSLALRLVQYQRDSLKALYLAKAGLNRAIVELEKDLTNPYTKDYDALIETWSHNEGIFKEIRLTDNENEYAQVSYDFEENRRQDTRFGVIDEESKININTASQEVLVDLLKLSGIDDARAQDIATDILKWRGSLEIDEDTANFYKNNLHYPCKGGKFSVLEELSLVKGIEDIEKDEYEKLKNLITIWGKGRVNINTASKEVLKALGLTAVTKLQTVPGANISATDVAALVETIISFRDRGEYFKTNEIDTERMKNRLTLRPLDEDNRTKIINELIAMQLLTAVSENFKIKATGNVNNIIKRITAIYDRADKKKVVSYHEN